MAEPFEVKIRVVQSQGTGQVANLVPEKFQDPDIDQISSITNRIVENLQKKLQPPPEQKGPGSLALSELELTFGIEFGVEANVKIPIISILSGNARSGMTFEVHIKLTREIS